MKRPIPAYLLCFILFSLIANVCYAQNSTASLPANSGANPQEKIYIHYDKSNYLLGDTVWFKAYLYDGVSRSKLSTSFYLELLNDKGKVLKRFTAPIFESTASGNITLDPDTSAGSLYIRAYTASMLKDTAYVYLNKLSIINFKSKPRPVTKIAAQIKFMPEGGRWVNGLPSVMAFKATDANGMPVKVQGKIMSGNEVITTFTSQHDGMGAFTIQPGNKQQFTAAWQDEKGNNYFTTLPGAEEEGVVLHIEDVPNGKKFFILRSGQAGDEYRTLTLVASSTDKIFYKAKVDLSQEDGSNGIIPTKALPDGIINITVLNRGNNTIAERLCFVNNHTYRFNIDTGLTVINKRKRGLNQLKLSIGDTIRTNLSLAITDADVDQAAINRDNIISHLLLTSDLRGKIVDPYYYFSNNSDSTAKHLDLVMLTNGWRKNKLNKTGITNTPEHRYITIDGKLSGVPGTFFKTKPVANIIVQAADSSSIMLPVTVNNEGAFFKEGLLFYGESKLFFKFTDKYLKSATRLDIKIKNGLLNNVAVPFTGAEQNVLSTTIDTLTPAQSSRLAGYKPSFAVKQLKEVFINGYKQTDMEKLDKTYTSGMFSGATNYKNVNIGTDPKKINYLSIFQYLRVQVPGIKVYNDLSVYPWATWRMGPGGELPVFFYLNNFKVSAGDISKINIDEFDYIKIYDPGEAGVFGNSPGGVIAVYTKKGKGISYSSDNNKSLILEGYSPVKEFYSPDYASGVSTSAKLDTRTTLYWNPNIILDKNNKEFNLKFYNNDITSRFKIVLEGINNDGKLVFIEKTL